MTEDPLRYPTVLFDWGDTVLRDDPGMTAPMVEWETVEAIDRYRRCPRPPPRQRSRANFEI